MLNPFPHYIVRKEKIQHYLNLHVTRSHSQKKPHFILSMKQSTYHSIMVIMRHLAQEQVNFHSDLQGGSLLCYLVVLLKDPHLHKEVDDVVEVHSYYAADDAQVVVDHVADGNREVEDKDFFDLHQDEKKKWKGSHCTEEDGEHDHHLHENHLRCCLEGEELLLLHYHHHHC